MRLVLLVVCATVLVAQSGIDLPAIGKVVDSQGRQRTVYGVAGSFLVGPVENLVDPTEGARVFELPDGTVYAADDQIVLRRSDATEQRFDLAGTDDIAALGEHYAAIRCGDQFYALRLDRGREQLYVLPGAAP